MEQLLFDTKRGFLLFVVLALLDTGPKYAYEIKQTVRDVTGGIFDIDQTNLYRKLRKLEHENILRNFEKPSAHGANRKYYTLTPFGREFYREIYSLMSPVIDSFYKRMQNP
jgi:PadR family transcriptional regulator PadR